jgi:hypothetical protein
VDSRLVYGRHVRFHKHYADPTLGVSTHCNSIFPGPRCTIVAVECSACSQNLHDHKSHSIHVYNIPTVTVASSAPFSRITPPAPIRLHAASLTRHCSLGGPRQPRSGQQARQTPLPRPRQRRQNNTPAHAKERSRRRTATNAAPHERGALNRQCKVHDLRLGWARSGTPAVAGLLYVSYTAHSVGCTMNTY